MYTININPAPVCTIINYLKGGKVRWRIAMVGKPKLNFAAEAAKLYLKRLRRWTSIEIISTRPGRPETESKELARLTEGWYRILLDEKGQQVTSLKFSQMLQNWEVYGLDKISLLIGGADGHTDELYKKADWVWSLSKLTIQHELAFIVVLEQVYRAYTIMRETPYHRE